MARSAGSPGATSFTPTRARLTPHWRSSPWFTLQPTETRAAVRAGSGRGVWSSGAESRAMPESYQTPYAASGRGPSDDDFMTRSMFQDGLHYDLVAMDAVTQLSTAHLRLLAQSGRRLAESL